MPYSGYLPCNFNFHDTVRKLSDCQVEDSETINRNIGNGSLLMLHT